MTKLRNLIIILFFLFSFKNVRAQTDHPNYITIADTFCLYKKLPKLITANSILSVSCDSVYLMNKYQYRLYDKARKVILNSTYADINHELMNSYEYTLADQNKNFKDLFDRYNQLGNQSLEVMNSSKNALTTVNSSLSSAQKSLELANNNLSEANKIINSEKREANKSKFVIGLASLASGLIIGLLIAH